jgi:hypothetical protein
VFSFALGRPPRTYDPDALAAICMRDGQPFAVSFLAKEHSFLWVPHRCGFQGAGFGLCIVSISKPAIRNPLSYNDLQFTLDSRY